MSAPAHISSDARHVVVPAQQTITSGRSPWPDPAPACRRWLAGTGQADLHRVERWERGGDGRMYARCGKPAVLWMELNWWATSQRDRCLDCEDVDDVT